MVTRWGQGLGSRSGSRSGDQGQGEGFKVRGRGSRSGVRWSGLVGGGLEINREWFF